MTWDEIGNLNEGLLHEAVRQCSGLRPPDRVSTLGYKLQFIWGTDKDALVKIRFGKKCRVVVYFNGFEAVIKTKKLPLLTTALKEFIANPSLTTLFVVINNADCRQMDMELSPITTIEDDELDEACIALVIGQLEAIRASNALGMTHGAALNLNEVKRLEDLEELSVYTQLAALVDKYTQDLKSSGYKLFKQMHTLAKSNED